MSEDLSAKYYQKKKTHTHTTKKGFKKGLKIGKGVKIFQKKKKTKSQTVVANNSKIFCNMKNKGWLSIEK